MAVGTSDFYDLKSEKRYQIDREDFGKFVMVFSGQQSEEEVGKYISEKTFQELEKSPKAYVGKVIREPYDKYVDANQGPKLLAYTKGGLLPVLALLALGWSFAWVKRGFQRNVGA